ncbi:helix-turn-helix domain-containing protein [Lentzea cavernae]|uniref:Transcriptional regulator n=1 Tax=Lentzea cavernae TaxID=2020703 RepID=A0ABQ3MMA2_9PSEU|nr:helix-turn-helix transcriptional regulator [Lentzea cavernae]GHH48729.1 transcriptional regulator [Lentzea cavernae]
MAEPTFRQKRLGEALQLLRERAGMSQKEAADRLDYNVPKLSRIENGQVPDIHALRAMLDIYGVIGDEEAPYVEMWELAKEKGWWRAFGLDAQGYISLEHDASRVREFSLAVIPGQLQIEQYTRNVFDGAVIKRSRKSIENDIAVRQRRQSRLIGDDPLEYHVVLFEAALWHVDRAQLLHLVDIARLPNIVIQVLRGSPRLHDGLFGSFTLLDLPFAGNPRILYIEHMAGSIHIEDPERVATASLVFKHVSKLALTPEESAAFIERLAAER